MYLVIDFCACSLSNAISFHFLDSLDPYFGSHAMKSGRHVDWIYIAYQECSQRGADRAIALGRRFWVFLLVHLNVNCWFTT